MSYRTILIGAATAVFWSSGSADAQVPRNCGDEETAADRLEYVLKYFTADGFYDTLRVGKWPKLPPSVPASVVTRRPDCNRIVDSVNDKIEEVYPPTSEFRDGTALTHMIWSIGDYYVVLFMQELSLGWNPLYILNRDTLEVLWMVGA